MNTDLFIDPLFARVRLDGRIVAEIARPRSCGEDPHWEAIAATWGALIQGAIAAKVLA